MVASGVYDVAIASRSSAGTPARRHASLQIRRQSPPDLCPEFLIGQKLSEYHSGYRAFSRQVLETLPLLANSDDFVFDNQMLVQCHFWHFKIAEISCPTKYFAEASSINFGRSVRYGFGVLGNSLAFMSSRLRVRTPAYLNRETADRFKLSRLPPERGSLRQHRNLSAGAYQSFPNPVGQVAPGAASVELRRSEAARRLHERMRQGRQQQLPTDRIAHFALTPVQAYPHLAVRNPAERPAVLPGYALTSLH